MDFEEGCDLINHAFFERQREMLFTRWVTNYETSGMSFEEFKSKLMPVNDNSNSNKTSNEILKDVKEILQDFEI